MSSEFDTINLETIRQAHKRIAPLIARTPLKPAYTLGKSTGKEIYLKLETTQPTGAFKLRGAANALLSLPQSVRDRGVVTLSSGNHGKAMAYVAGKLGIRAVIGLSDQVPEVKVQAIRDLGAEVQALAMDQFEATKSLRAFAASHGMAYISPFDHPDVICGQGTIALEILEEQPDIDTLLIPLSGGGLLAGMGVAARALKPGIRIIGVSQEDGACMHESMKAGKLVPVIEKPSLADALLGGLPEDNQYTFPLCRDLIDHTILLSEKEIGHAMAYGFRRERLVLEGGGAVVIGAALHPDHGHLLGEKVAGVCSGDNVDIGVLLDQVAAFPDP